MNLEFGKQKSGKQITIKHTSIAFLSSFVSFLQEKPFAHLIDIDLIPSLKEINILVSNEHLSKVLLAIPIEYKNLVTVTNTLTLEASEW